MLRSSLYRAFGVLNRCVLGGGLLVSFTASASVDATKGFSIATYHPPMLLTKHQEGGNQAALGIIGDDDPLIIIPAHMGLGPEFTRDGSTALRYQEKLGAPDEPRVNTLGKSDPLPAFVHGVDGQTPSPVTALNSESPSLPDASKVPLASTHQIPPKSGSFGLTPKAISAGRTPNVAGSSTLSIALIFRHLPRLAVTGEQKLGGGSILVKALPPPRTFDARPIYAGLIDTRNFEKEQRCLAEAIYFEARSEPEQGQAAVAQVVLNRLKSEYYPKSICDVVYQNKERYLGCEFTFACEGKSLAINEPDSWAVATRLAKQVYEGAIYNAEVGEATHYHADYVRPYWAKALEKRDVIGRHIFYSLKPGLPGGVCPGCLLAKAAG